MTLPSVWYCPECSQVIQNGELSRHVDGESYHWKEYHQVRGNLYCESPAVRVAVVPNHFKALSSALRDAVRADGAADYESRALHIATAIGYAGRAGIEWGIRIDPAEPEWPVVYFELPTGQVTYHMPQHPIEWDGHDVPEKNQRISQWRPA